MANGLVEITVMVEMNDGGGLTSPDLLASTAAGLISVAAHAWKVNATIGKAAYRSGDISGYLSGGIAAPEG